MIKIAENSCFIEISAKLERIMSQLLFVWIYKSYPT